MGVHRTVPRQAAVELDDLRVGARGDRLLDQPLGAGARGRGGDLPAQDPLGQHERLVEQRVDGRRIVGLVPAGVEGRQHAADAHHADVGDQGGGDRLPAVMGIDALDERCVDARRHGLVVPAQARAELAPDEPEGGIADAVRPLAGAAALVVVEVAGGRIVGVPDVDADVGGGELLPVTRADDLDVVVREPDHGDGEDLVGVEGPRVRGDDHGRTVRVIGSR